MKWIFSSLVLFLTACSSTPKKDSSPLYTPTQSSIEEDASPRIDYLSLQRSLGLNRDAENLGYTEKTFNTCDAGYGYSSHQDCHQEVFMVLHFKLSCRDSEGTISSVLTDADVAPIAYKDLKWKLKDIDGTITTDGGGYGQIRATSKKSQKRERLKIALGPDFLYMRANEITKVITPRSWCAN
jgi:hypothetical protein